MLRSLASALALGSVLACGGSTGASHPDGGDASSGGASEAGAPSCTLQACGSGCCAGAYCWAFSNICVQDGTCPAAGINTPAPGLCTCDGFPAGACSAGEVCPAGAHGHASFCTPDDGGAGD
jgi:hypothetical protein